jgi:hypothetical protein
MALSFTSFEIRLGEQFGKQISDEQRVTVVSCSQRSLSAAAYRVAWTHRTRAKQRNRTAVLDEQGRLRALRERDLAKSRSGIWTGLTSELARPSSAVA